MALGFDGASFPVVKRLMDEGLLPNIQRLRARRSGLRNLVTLNNIFKVGIVGCGEISKAHLKAWNKLKDVRVTAVCDLNIQLAKDFANKWGVPSCYQDFITMLENEDFNILSVCTPPTARSQIILPAVKQGIHVIVEKPFTLTVSEANEMLEAAKKNRVKLCVVRAHISVDLRA